jgi:hypothetical protein
LLHIVGHRVAARFKQTGVGDPSGKLIGKAALQAYFQEALDNLAVIKLDLQVTLSSQFRVSKQLMMHQFSSSIVMMQLVWQDVFLVWQA